MEAGKLRHQITIQAKSSDQDEFGEDLAIWTTVATVWGSVEPISAKMATLNQANSAIATATHEIHLRYRPGLTPANRIVYRTRIFTITAIRNPEERNRELIVLAVEVV